MSVARADRLFLTAAFSFLCIDGHLPLMIRGLFRALQSFHVCGWPACAQRCGKPDCCGFPQIWCSLSVLLGTFSFSGSIWVQGGTFSVCLLLSPFQSCAELQLQN